MIGYLRGEVLAVEQDHLLVRAGDVGYEVSCTPMAMAQAAVGVPIELKIYTQVREDAIQLYGFLRASEKQLFTSLIKVNGIGPRSALQILSAAPVEEITALINEGDAKGLSQLPKVGKKTAEQIVLTLKGKLVSAESSAAQPSAARGVRSEIVSALVHLGFRLPDVEKVVERMPPNVDLETGVRDGLAALTN